MFVIKQGLITDKEPIIIIFPEFKALDLTVGDMCPFKFIS